MLDSIRCWKGRGLSCSRFNRISRNNSSQEFTVELRGRKHATYSIRYSVDVDGNCITKGRVIRPDKKRRTNQVFVSEVLGFEDTPATFRPLVFGVLETTGTFRSTLNLTFKSDSAVDDDTYLDQALHKDMGTINCRLSTVIVTKSRPPVLSARYQVPSLGSTVHERSKKAGNHSVQCVLSGVWTLFVG